LPEKQSLAPQDQFMLAQLYLAEADWQKANSRMSSLLNSHGKEPRYVAAYASALLRQGQTAEAEKWLSRLEKLAPKRFLTVSLRADAFFQQGEYDQAIGLLEDFLESADSQPADRAARLDLVATSLQEFARRLKDISQQSLATKLFRKAEAVRRQYIAEHPEQELMLAVLLAQEGRLDDALELAERAWKKSPPAAIANVTAAVLAGAASPEQIRRMEAILVAALEKHGRPVPLLLILADLQALQQRHKEAEVLFREVIEKDQAGVLAMNNLAVLLALQGTRLDEALELIEKAIRTAGPVSTLLDSRASVYLTLGQANKALADLEAAIADAPKPNRYFHKAQALYELGQEEAAGEALAKARQLGLKPELLDPLEQSSYRKLEAELQ